MDKCKFCGAELEEGSAVCPKCGKNNAEEIPAAIAVEEPVPEKKLSSGMTILALLAVVVVIVLLAAVVMNGRKPGEVVIPTEETAAVETAETAETTEATVPADGNPDDVTCKGTYSAADDAVLAARDTVVATAGDFELTLGQLQVYYWMEFRSFMSQYGAYAAYFGLDVLQPLDTQMCNVMDTPMTWQQYFLQSALNSWVNYTSMAAEGQANGFALTELQETTLANMEEDLTASALENGFESADDMIHQALGNAVQLSDYAVYMENYFRASGYYGELCSGIAPTDEELSAYFDEHAEGYAQSGITKDSVYVDVRHILIYPEGATDDTIRSEEFPEEAWTAGEAAAAAILDEWLAGDATEDSFAALANEHSKDPGSNTTGGLYQDVTTGQMVEAFDAWCFDPARKVGDTGIVRTEFGFHVMYFSGSRPMWNEYAESDYISETAAKLAEEIAARFPMAVKYADILLGNVEIN